MDLCIGANAPDVCDFIESGPTGGTSLETWLISSSFLFSYVQHTAEWPDYYAIVDVRKGKAFDKSHVVGAVNKEDIADSIYDWTHEMILVLYDTKPKTENLMNFLRSIETAEASPAAIYILGDKLAVFKKRYRFAMSSFIQTEGQFPGPVEYVPKTKLYPAIYTIHRNHFSGCKTLIAYLRCTTVLNVSSKRLFVKTPGISLENVQFDEENEPFERAIKALFNYLEPKKKGQKSILIIDETGCDYGALLIGWFLVSRCGKNVEEVNEHLTNKSAEFDPWYADILREWASKGAP